MKQHPSFLARQAKARGIAEAFAGDQEAEDFRARFAAGDAAERQHFDGVLAQAVARDDAKSAKRRRMLRDIMITAFEGGSNYWAEARNVMRDDTPDEGLAAYGPGSFLDRTGRHHGDYVSFEVRSFEDRTDKRLGKWHLIDEAEVERGLRLILNGQRARTEEHSPVSVRRDILGALALANVSPEEADIDAEAADCIIQAAAFGEIVYG